MALARGFIRGGKSRVRVLSSRAFSAVGRPSPGTWTNRGAPLGESKRSVRRLIRRDPAKGRSLPLADNITETHMEGNAAGIGPVPTISRDKTAPPNNGLNQVKARGTNRSIKKR